MKKNFSLLLIVVFAGCSHSYVFKDAAPVETVKEQPVTTRPEKSTFNFVSYAVSSSVRYPLVDSMNTKRTPRALDVNALDDLPKSSWFTPRLGYQKISSEELLKGPQNVGAPKTPYKIIKAKKAGNSPGFLIEDARGEKYLLKFDHSDYPDLESTVNFVVNRLFWGFGYNVPEDYLIKFKLEDLKDDASSGVTQDDIDHVLTLAASPDDDGNYRATASLFLKGKILGPIPQRGTRKGDPNDTVPHQDMRVLRALRMFAAWTDQSGLRSDNSMDVYEGPEGQGHVVHYLLDFGEALGAHGVEKDRVWDGYEHNFSYQDTAKNFFKFGFPVKKWENLKVVPEDPRGSFEAEIFDPHTWRETTQFMPIRKSQADDDYWAAKIIAGVTHEHLQKLFDATKHPDPEYVKYMVETLMKRREEVMAYAFSRVTPLESKGIKNGSLELKDVRREFLKDTAEDQYEVRYYNKNHKRVAKTSILAGSENLQVPVAEALKAAKGYLRVEIRAIHGGKKAPRSAEFHINNNSGSPRLIGVVH